VTTRSPNTFVVGAGPVATALAGALRLAGVPVLGLWARKPAAARAAGAVAGVAAFSAAPPDLLLEADVVLIAVNDEAVSEVATTLVGTGMVTTRHVLMHCSGAFGAVEAFAAVQGKVGGIATLHPLRAIADGRAAMRSMKGTVFGVEGDERGKAAAQALVTVLGGVALGLAGTNMAAYHAAAAMASNFAVALVDAAAVALRASGVPHDQALAALVPLAQGALANVAAHGTERGLTGPIRRGDEQTVARHLDALAHDPALVELYAVLGRWTLEVAARVEGPDQPAPAALAAIKDRLEAAGKGAPDPGHAGPDRAAPRAVRA
jgi:predicted short-subunit dehydrogenase-like oxidoreductase (DUF2520 family)